MGEVDLAANGHITCCTTFTDAVQLVFTWPLGKLALETRGKPIHGRSATASMLWKVSNASSPNAPDTPSEKLTFRSTW
jgi:hypothetical protein